MMPTTPGCQPSAPTTSAGTSGSSICAVACASASFQTSSWIPLPLRVLVVQLRRQPLRVRLLGEQEIERQLRLAEAPGGRSGAASAGMPRRAP
jgi:hypothetical protein